MQLPAPLTPQHIAAYLAELCVRAHTNVQDGIGGPFAAMLVEESTGRVLGIGTNHVGTRIDPTAHAEMEALRAAGLSDLSGVALLTSCECCPMCLSAATALGVSRIHFAASRADAEAAGFSDAAQYRLMAEPLATQCRQVTEEERLAAVLCLATDDAVVLVPRGMGTPHRFGGGTWDGTDPTATPCLRAIRAACAALELFHLPQDTVLLSRTLPHPLSLMAADWARIGRRRDPAHADDPAYDAAEKFPGAIQYLETLWETLPAPTPHDAETVLADLRLAPGTRQIVAEAVATGDLSAFDAWRALVARGDRARY